MTDNPYVGPQPFGADQRALFFGRDREVAELADLLVAERVVLLHAPSGAGKTSLIQAGLIPALRTDFEILPVIRVGNPAPDGVNRYRYSALYSLGGEAAAAAAAATSLVDYLDHHRKTDRPQLVVFDQFEEVLTLDPLDRDAKDMFFTDLGILLRRERTGRSDPGRWALFSMRDEFVAALTPYLKRLPTRIGVMSRLDLLGRDAALDAVRRPAEERGIHFDEVAAGRLVDNLRRVRGATPGEPGPLGPDVEPVQLQVVCYGLWEKFRERAVGPPESDPQKQAAQDARWNQLREQKAVSISTDDVAALADVDRALADYYAGRVGRAAERGKVSERAVRAWVANHLITPAGFRSAVQIGSGVGWDPPREVLDDLDDAHLIRRDVRLHQVWVQLAHDRLVDPIRANNRRWMEDNLVPFQLQALQWEGQGEPRKLLLTGTALREAEKWASWYPERLSDTDLRLLEASGGWIATTRWQRVRRHLYRTGRGYLAAAIVLVIFAFAVYAQVERREAEKQRTSAEKSQASALASEKVATEQKVIAEVNLQKALAAEERLAAIEKESARARAELEKTAFAPHTFAQQLTDEEKLAAERANRRRVRPIEPGLSISGPNGTAGTLGCFVRDKQGKVYLLTLDHALQADGVSIGEPVIQPGRIDGGDVKHDEVAVVTRLVPLPCDPPNACAAVLAELQVGWKPELSLAGKVVPGDAKVGDEVLLLGRTSPLSRGRVTGMGVTLRIRFGSKGLREAVCHNLIAIQGVDGAFSRAGDSGGPVLTRDGRLIGLLHAGSQETGYAVPIKPILADFGVELVTTRPKGK
jgi:hypothetical protein